jgi:NADH:ubiquinone oxidoreductase subunit 5 (subunit L)/multisubunit Na+/H+ antiporter MnhA subunit
MAWGLTYGGAAWLPLIFGVVGAFMTTFYMLRLVFLTFHGAPADHHRFEHAHESPPSMWVPLAILAVPSVLLGFVPFGSFVHRGELEHHGIDFAIAIPRPSPAWPASVSPGCSTGAGARRPRGSPRASAGSTARSTRSSTSTRSTSS